MTDTTAAATGQAPAVLRWLLRGIVDYAGLFPPASLDMSSAVGEYALHRDGAESWALGRFVLPAARLAEFDETAAHLLPREGSRSWALSALLGTDVEQDVGRIEEFNTRHRDARAGAVLVDTVELKTHSVRDVARASELLDRRFDTYMEVPVADDPAELIDAIGETTCKAKIRTGGLTTDVFPTSAHVQRFIKRCVDRGVGFKATAGLHHPIRAEYRLTYASDAPKGPMFGFLNVLLGVAATHEALSGGDVIAVLEERDADAFAFCDHAGSPAAEWRGRRLSTESLERARESLTAFGSCSFREPVDDLRALHLL